MRIGIDLGGTKIEALALAEDGRERARRRVATPRGDYQQTLRAMADLVLTLEAELGETGTVGVGIPGTISQATGLVKNANSTWLIGRPLGEDLPRLLDRPVRFANDANCFALSEATDGAASGAPSCVRRDRRYRHRRRGGGERPAWSSAQTRSVASGGITHCRRRGTRNGRGHGVIAAVTAASKRSCPGQDWHSTSRLPAVARPPPPRFPVAPRPATRVPRPH